MTQLVLLRHGESIWNQLNIFTGWTDIALSEKGKAEAQSAGRMLNENGFVFDTAYSSVLTRAVQTLCTVLAELNLKCVTAKLDWRLNERHYGALQGLNKAETAEKYGDAQVKLWRRSYQSRPMPVDDQDLRSSKFDPRYHLLKNGQIPNTESLEDVEHRLIPCWKDRIAQDIRTKRRTLIVAHGNSLRALIKHLDHISDQEIIDLNIPTGIPLIYQLDDDLNSLSHEYLTGDDEADHATQVDPSDGISEASNKTWHHDCITH